MTPRYLVAAAFCVLGFSTSVHAQLFLDPEINRQAAECAATGNCSSHYTGNGATPGANRANPYETEAAAYERNDKLRMEQENRDRLEQYRRDNAPATPAEKLELAKKKKETRLRNARLHATK